MVIAIIGILAALLLPALQKARGFGKMSVCIGNLRELAVAAVMYTGDHNDRLAYGINPHYYQDATKVQWCSYLLPYVGGSTQVVECPACLLQDGRRFAYGNLWTTPNNVFRVVDPPLGGIADLRDVHHPAKLHLFTESATHFGNSATSTVAPSQAGWPLGSWGDKQYAANHFGPSGAAGNEPAFFATDSLSRTVAAY